MPLRIHPFLAVPVLLAAQPAPPPVAPPEDPKHLFLQARALQRRNGGNDPNRAVALYRKVVAALPESAEAHLRLAEALVETGDAESAVAPARRATELNPRSSEAWTTLGIIQQYRGSREQEALAEAQRAFDRATRLLPWDAELWWRYAETAQVRRDYPASLRAWLRLGRLNPLVEIQRSGPSGPERMVLAELAWRQAAAMAREEKQYDARREALMALCRRRAPRREALAMLEELAQEQVQQGFLGHAEDSFKLLSLAQPQEPGALENVAYIQQLTDRYEEALQNYLKVEAIRSSPRLSFRIAETLMHLGRFEEADARWTALLPKVEKADDNDRLEDRIRIHRATCLLLLGRSRDALALLNTWPQTADHGELLALRFQALAQTSTWKPARATLSEGIARYPDVMVFAIAKALPPKVLEDNILQKVFTRSSRQVMAQLDQEAMASLWARYRRWEPCLEAVQAARRSAPVRDVDLLLLQADALDNLGRRDEALATLREGQRLRPDHPTLLNNLGYLLLERGDALEEASQLIEASYRQQPDNGSVVDSWGWALFKQGRLEESERILRRAVELSPYSPEVRKHFGEVLLRLGRPAEAAEHWERAIAFAFPDRKDLEKRLSALRTETAKQRDRDEAEEAAPEPDGTPAVDEEDPGPDPTP